MEEKSLPKKIYRGVVLNYEQFKGIDFEADLFPPNPPKIDEYGRKTVGDGNEYGLYMTDNLNVAEEAYGRPETSTANIGIIYEIDTNGIDIRKPWLAPVWAGAGNGLSHYNNGYAGNEWIADSIPRQNFRIKSIILPRIALDSLTFLFDREKIEISDENRDIEQIIPKIVERNEKNALVNGLKKKIPTIFKEFNAKAINALCVDLFGKDGIYRAKLDEFDMTTDNGKINYLLADYYQNDLQQLDYKSLCFLESVKQDISKSGQTLEEVINERKNSNRQAYEKRIAMGRKVDDIEESYRMMEQVSKRLENGINRFEERKRKQHFQDKKDILTFFDSGVVKGDFERVQDGWHRTIINGEEMLIPIERDKTIVELNMDRKHYRETLDLMVENGEISDEEADAMHAKIERVYRKTLDDKKTQSNAIGGQNRYHISSSRDEQTIQEKSENDNRNIGQNLLSDEFEEDLFKEIIDGDISEQEIRSSMRITNELNMKELYDMQKEGRELSEKEQEALRTWSERMSRNMRGQDPRNR